MKPTKPKSFRATAMAAAAMLVSTGLQAGVIRNTNPTPGAPLGSCGPTQAATQACVGAMDLTNVETTVYKADGTVLGTMDNTTGDYPAMGVADYFVSLVKSGASIVAKLGGKVWPVGEPMAVKAVVGDMDTKEGKPNNCIINTAYLSADKNSGVSGFLDQTTPVPVICSSDFQSHKRFKIPMQPASLDPATPIDLVFNVVDETAAGNPIGLPSLPAGALDTVVNPNNLRYYQVFSKINNYTGQRLAGYKVVVGTGTGIGFVEASKNGLASKLHLSIGIGEGWSSGATAMPNGSDLTDEDGGATFSHGLFGPAEPPMKDGTVRWPVNGFFDERIAGFGITQECANTNDAAACPTYDNPLFNNTDPTDPGNTLTAFDTVKSTTPLLSNYVDPAAAAKAVGLPFGDWLPFGWHPKGIFFDTDNDATTDADLVAWWNGTQWLKNYDSGFAPATEAELATWGSDKGCGTASAPRSCYGIDDIEDTVNLGINYTIKVGDGIPGGKVTVRIIPIAAADQTPPVWVGTTPAELPTTTAPVTTDGGGCSASTSQRPVDPVLPLLAALGLAGWALRRARRN